MSEFNTQSYNDRQAPLDAAKAAYFAAGGQVQNLGECHYVPPHTHTPVAADPEATRRRIERANDRIYAARIRDLAKGFTPTGPVLRNVFEVRNLLRAEGIRLQTGQVEQIAAAHGIELKFTGKSEADGRDFPQAMRCSHG